MNKYIKESLKDHKHKFRTRELKHKLLKVILLLSIVYCLVFGALNSLPSINKTTDIARNWTNQQLQRTNCYDLLQYQKLYPDTELTKQAELLCGQYR